MGRSPVHNVGGWSRVFGPVVDYNVSGWRANGFGPSVTVFVAVLAVVHVHERHALPRPIERPQMVDFALLAPYGSGRWRVMSLAGQTA